MMVTCPRTVAFSVVTMGLVNGGKRHAYSTISTPTRATAAKASADSHWWRRSGCAMEGAAGAAAVGGAGGVLLFSVIARFRIGNGDDGHGRLRIAHGADQATRAGGDAGPGLADQHPDQGGDGNAGDHQKDVVVGEDIGFARGDGAQARQ